MALIRDLFGNPLPPAEQPARRKIGYAAKPGSGPKKARCLQCVHFVRVTNPGEEANRCELTAKVWDKPGSTIKANAPACLYWRRRPFDKMRAA